MPCHVPDQFVALEQIDKAVVSKPWDEHLGHLLSWAVQCRLTVEQMLEMPFYHPVVEEGVRTALRDLAANLAKGDSDLDPDEVEPGT